MPRKKEKKSEPEAAKPTEPVIEVPADDPWNFRNIMPDKAAAEGLKTKSLYTPEQVIEFWMKLVFAAVYYEDGKDSRVFVRVGGYHTNDPTKRSGDNIISGGAFDKLRKAFGSDPSGPANDFTDTDGNKKLWFVWGNLGRTMTMESYIGLTQWLTQAIAEMRRSGEIADRTMEKVERAIEMQFEFLRNRAPDWSHPVLTPEIRKEAIEFNEGVAARKPEGYIKKKNIQARTQKVDINAAPDATEGKPSGMGRGPARKGRWD